MNNDIKVYDKTKTNILEEYDLNLGYLQDDFIIKHHDKIEGQEEEGHYEIVAEYENGGKDVNWIIDKEYIEEVPEWDEQIFIKIYIPYTEAELHNKPIIEQIDVLNEELNRTDYLTLKYIDGEISEEDYTHIKEYRHDIRIKINELEGTLMNEEIRENN